MRPVAAGLLLAILLVSPLAMAVPSAAIDATKSCSSSVPGFRCEIAQAGSLEIVCAANSCDLVLRGVAVVTDAHPVKQITTTMHIASSMSTVTVGCVGIGPGTATCELDAQFPFVTGAGRCDRITIGTEYDRLPLGPVKVSRAFNACREADGTLSVQPA